MRCYRGAGLARSAIQPLVSVIDGEGVVRQSLRTLIEGAGWQARVYSSGGEFLSQPREEHPNCLLLNAQLPDISGLELQARMVDRPETPIIFISGQVDIAATVRAMKGGRNRISD